VLLTLRAVAIVAALLVALTACDVASVETPDPAAVPSGEPVAIGAEATGPVTLLGEGQASGLGWRYVMYESADGSCTELQLVEVTTTGCGPDLLPPEGDAFGTVNVGDPLANGVIPVDGIVSDEIFTVWVIEEQTGNRIPAPLFPLDDAGLEGQAFLGFVPDGMTPTHIQALARSGEILQTYEVP
jgi:hypothetical protein